MWDTVTWRVRSTLEHTRTSTYDPNNSGPVGGTGRAALTFAPDNRSLAVVLPDSITVWDTTSHRQIASLVQYGADFTAVAFGHDRHTAVVQSGSNYIALWDTTNGQPVVTLHSLDIHENQLLSYDPDRGTVALYTPDGGMVLWQTDPDVVSRQLCRDTAGGAILPEHWNQIASGTPRVPVCQNR